MTAVAGTKAYSREYQRLRQRGLSTKGLAEKMRAGGVGDLVPAATRVLVEQALARGVPDEQICQRHGITAVQLSTIMEGML